MSETLAPQKRAYRKRLPQQDYVDKARNAALARTTVDALIDSLLAKTVEKAPPLTDAQRARLQPILGDDARVGA
jgi:hypothetical protein